MGTEDITVEPIRHATTEFLLTAVEVGAIAKLTLKTSGTRRSTRWHRLFFYIGFVILAVVGLVGARLLGQLPRGATDDMLFVAFLVMICSYFAGFLGSTVPGLLAAQKLFRSIADAQVPRVLGLTSHGVEMRTNGSRGIQFYGSITKLEKTPLFWLAWAGSGICVTIPLRAFATVATEAEFTAEVQRQITAWHEAHSRDSASG